MDIDKETFIIGRHKLSEGEILTPDPSAYDMLHTLGSTWPCLSIDVIPDNLGQDRTSYPMTVYAVAGTQADRGKEKQNQLMIMKLSGLNKMEHDDGSASSDDESDADVDTDPILETKTIAQTSTTNRIRAHQSAEPTPGAPPPPTLTASMMESGLVLIHDITPHLAAFDSPSTAPAPGAAAAKPVCTIRAHKGTEGFALDWAPQRADGAAAARLLTGDNAGNVFLTTRTPGGGFVTDTTPYLDAAAAGPGGRAGASGAAAAVEEVHWSPSERSVFASAATDGVVRVWDARAKRRAPAVSVAAHRCDVNVLSWSGASPHLLATGAEDGAWAVWDLRQWKSLGAGGGGVAKGQQPVAQFRFNKEQITCLEFHPHDDSIVLVGAGDSTLSLWDLAVEPDEDEAARAGKAAAEVRDVPPQLLFVHYMDQAKEGHWHPQIPGAVVATGGAGFGVFKTISV
jgi:ribosome assembly protein RRB1